MPGTQIALVDAFCSGAFTGNPAAVCLLEQEADARWMQQLAMEMNQAETAFVVPANIPGSFQLRWFTPTAEVDLCGHATLASASLLWEVCPGLPDALSFETRSGTLLASRGAEGKITLDFPAAPPYFTRSVPGLAALLGCKEETVICSGLTRFDAFLHVNSTEAVLQASPDMRALAELPVRGVIITAASDRQDADFVSRFFAPAVGVPEDPVTGSAHCSLSPYWSSQLGRNKLVGKQLSKRGGTVETELRGDRVLLSGRAVTVLYGQLQPLACTPGQ
jgi:PhzF family phenazine biosynthesis protein